jgi:hypothetical protein
MGFEGGSKVRSVLWHFPRSFDLVHVGLLEHVVILNTASLNLVRVAFREHDLFGNRQIVYSLPVGFDDWPAVFEVEHVVHVPGIEVRGLMRPEFPLNSKLTQKCTNPSSGMRSFVIQ